MKLGPSPVDLVAVFADRWEGKGRLWRPPWWRWLPFSESFDVASERFNVADDSWEVLDKFTFPKGRVQHRTMHAQKLTDDRHRLTADTQAVAQTAGSRALYRRFAVRKPWRGVHRHGRPACGAGWSGAARSCPVRPVPSFIAASIRRHCAAV